MVYAAPKSLRNALPDEIRYAVVGASTVAGIYAKANEQTFSQLLASAIKDKYQHRPVNIINAGIEGSSLSDTHQVTENVVYKLSPSAIIIYPGFNDITMLCPKKGTNSSNPLAQSPNAFQPLGYPSGYLIG